MGLQPFVCTLFVRCSQMNDRLVHYLTHLEFQIAFGLSARQGTISSPRLTASILTQLNMLVQLSSIDLTPGVVEPSIALQGETLLIFEPESLSTG